MKLIGKDKGLISGLTLISSRIKGINIYTSKYNLVVDVTIELMYSKSGETLIVLRLLDVKEFALYHNSDYEFYNIEQYKLFKRDEYVYLCFDPSDESETISDDDNDFFLCKSIEGYYISAQQNVSIL